MGGGVLDGAGDDGGSGGDVVGDECADGEEDDRQDGVDDGSSGEDRDPGEAGLGSEGAGVDADGESEDVGLAPVVDELSALFLGGDEVAGRWDFGVFVFLCGQGESPGGLAAVGFDVVEGELALVFAVGAEDSIEELIGRDDALAVDLEDAVAGDEVLLHAGVLVDGGDEETGGFLTGESDEAADGEPVEGVEGFAELLAFADSWWESDAELFDSDAGELGGDEVTEFVEDDESEEDSDEGEDRVDQDHGVRLLANVDWTGRRLGNSPAASAGPRLRGGDGTGRIGRW